MSPEGRTKPSVQPRLATIAAEQWGFVTRQQARQAGVSRASFPRLVSGGILKPVAHGVYHLAGAPLPDFVDLRAAWLQLAPDVPAWERRPEDGVVSHRSAARLYGLGDLPADRHEFAVAGRRQTRRPDVRIHRGTLAASDWERLAGLFVTRPARIAADLLTDRESPHAVGGVVADALRTGRARREEVAESIAGHARRLGFRVGDGFALLSWLLEDTGGPTAESWMPTAANGGDPP